MVFCPFDVKQAAARYVCMKYPILMASSNPSLLVVFVNEKYDNCLQRLGLGQAHLIGSDYKANSWGFICSSSSVSCLLPSPDSVSGGHLDCGMQLSLTSVHCIDFKWVEF
jgi:hypothetical protein